MNLQMPALSMLSLILCLNAVSAQPSGSEFEIWPGELPSGSVKLTEQHREKLQAANTVERIALVERASLTVMRPAEGGSNGCGVIICPGGGYARLAWLKEGIEVAQRLNQEGVTAFVLKYRVPRRSADQFHREPLQDLQRAIRVVRHRAEEWDVDPNRLGVLGFSAGGHLTVMSGVAFGESAYAPQDEADSVSCRPDFICPIYCAYLGPNYNDRDIVALSDLITVTPQTPPAFLSVTWDDAMRGAQSALLFAELKKHNVPAELHVFGRGGHGYGLRPTGKSVSQWPDLLTAWLREQKYIPQVEALSEQEN